MPIVATDTGGLSSTATARITVNRNLNTPTWTQTVYTSTIQENFALYSEILRLSASDLDTQAPHNTLTYTISSFNNNNAAQYFQVTSAGVLQLTRTLVGTLGNFTVCWNLLRITLNERVLVALKYIVYICSPSSNKIVPILKVSV